MKIGNVAKSPNFCRALCANEEQELKNLTKDLRGSPFRSQNSVQ